MATIRPSRWLVRSIQHAMRVINAVTDSLRCGAASVSDVQAANDHGFPASTSSLGPCCPASAIEAGNHGIHDHIEPQSAAVCCALIVRLVMA